MKINLHRLPSAIISLALVAGLSSCTGGAKPSSAEREPAQARPRDGESMFTMPSAKTREAFRLLIEEAKTKPVASSEKPTPMHVPLDGAKLQCNADYEAKLRPLEEMSRAIWAYKGRQDLATGAETPSLFPAPAECEAIEGQTSSNPAVAAKAQLAFDACVVKTCQDCKAAGSSCLYRMSTVSWTDHLRAAEPEEYKRVMMAALPFNPTTTDDDSFWELPLRMPGAGAKEGFGEVVRARVGDENVEAVKQWAEAYVERYRDKAASQIVRSLFHDETKTTPAAAAARLMQLNKHDRIGTISFTGLIHQLLEVDTRTLAPFVRPGTGKNSDRLVLLVRYESDEKNRALPEPAFGVKPADERKVTDARKQRKVVNRNKSRQVRAKKLKAPVNKQEGPDVTTYDGRQQLDKDLVDRRSAVYAAEQEALARLRAEGPESEAFVEAQKNASKLSDGLIFDANRIRMAIQGSNTYDHLVNVDVSKMDCIYLTGNAFARLALQQDLGFVPETDGACIRTALKSVAAGLPLPKEVPISISQPEFLPAQCEYVKHVTTTGEDGQVTRQKKASSSPQTIALAVNRRHWEFLRDAKSWCSNPGLSGKSRAEEMEKESKAIRVAGDLEDDKLVRESVDLNLPDGYQSMTVDEFVAFMLKQMQINTNYLEDIGKSDQADRYASIVSYLRKIKENEDAFWKLPVSCRSSANRGKPECALPHKGVARIQEAAVFGGGRSSERTKLYTRALENQQAWDKLPKECHEADGATLARLSGTTCRLPFPDAPRLGDYGAYKIALGKIKRESGGDSIVLALPVGTHSKLVQLSSDENARKTESERRSRVAGLTGKAVDDESVSESWSAYNVLELLAELQNLGRGGITAPRQGGILDQVLDTTVMAGAKLSVNTKALAFSLYRMCGFTVAEHCVEDLAAYERLARMYEADARIQGYKPEDTILKNPTGTVLNPLWWTYTTVDTAPLMLVSLGGGKIMTTGLKAFGIGVAEREVVTLSMAGLTRATTVTAIRNAEKLLIKKIGEKAFYKLSRQWRAELNLAFKAAVARGEATAGGKLTSDATSKMLAKIGDEFLERRVADLAQRLGKDAMWVRNLGFSPLGKLDLEAKLFYSMAGSVPFVGYVAADHWPKAFVQTYEQLREQGVPEKEARERATKTATAVSSIIAMTAVVGHAVSPFMSAESAGIWRKAASEIALMNKTGLDMALWGVEMKALIAEETGIGRDLVFEGFIDAFLTGYVLHGQNKIFEIGKILPKARQEGQAKFSRYQLALREKLALIEKLDGKTELTPDQLEVLSSTYGMRADDQVVLTVPANGGPDVSQLVTIVEAPRPGKNVRIRTVDGKEHQVEPDKLSWYRPIDVEAVSLASPVLPDGITDGTSVPVEMKMVALKDDAGKPTGKLGYTVLYADGSTKAFGFERPEVLAGVPPVGKELVRAPVEESATAAANNRFAKLIESSEIFRVRDTSGKGHSGKIVAFDGKVVTLSVGSKTGSKQVKVPVHADEVPLRLTSGGEARQRYLKSTEAADVVRKQIVAEVEKATVKTGKKFADWSPELQRRVKQLEDAIVYVPEMSKDATGRLVEYRKAFIEAEVKFLTGCIK